MQISVKSILFRLLRHVPMPLIAILIGLAVGVAVWALLDQVQGRQVAKIFDQELQAQLEQRARESLIRFDRYLSNYAATTRLLANHRQLAAYLEPLFWFEDDVLEPIIYTDFQPQWLSDFFDRQPLTAPSHILLTDQRGRIREIFQSGADALPAEISSQVSQRLLDVREVRSVIERLDERIYLLSTDAIEDAGGYAMGYLVVLVPIDDAFLASSQRGLVVERAAVALVDGDDQRIIASVDSNSLEPGSHLTELARRFLITSQSLPEYEGSSHTYCSRPSFRTARSRRCRGMSGSSSVVNEGSRPWSSSWCSPRSSIWCHRDSMPCSNG